MSPVPAPTIVPWLAYDDPRAAIAFLTAAFGFREHLVATDADGAPMHIELALGDALVMLGPARPASGWLSPRALAGLGQTVCCTIDDPDAHCARAIAAGATVTRPLEDTSYGARGYSARDGEGHEWHFSTYRPEPIAAPA